MDSVKKIISCNLKKENKVRNKKIDIMRGIAIILVVLGHSISNVEIGLNKIILSFHMPLFFIISGLVAKDLYKEDIKKIRCEIYKKKTILIYNFILGIILSLYWMTVRFIKCNIMGNQFYEIDFGKYFFKYWFLWTLLFVEIIFIMLSSHLNMKNKKIQIMILIVSVIIAVVSALKLKQKNMFHINIVPVAFVFYYLGFILKKHILSEKLAKFIENNIVFIIPILVILALLNTSVLMYENNYGNLLIFALTSVLGLLIVIWLSNNLENNTMINFLGRNSIIVYIVHFVIVESIRTILVKLRIINNYMVVSLLTFIISISIVLIITIIYLYIKNLYYDKSLKVKE